jgi:adenylate cyclase
VAVRKHLAPRRRFILAVTAVFIVFQPAARVILSTQSESKVNRWRAAVIAAVLAALFGALMLPRGSGEKLVLGGDLTRLSYDLPFCLRGSRPATNAVLIYLDDYSHGQLEQPRNMPWDRALHARLVERLVAGGARAIVFDILFTEAGTNETADAAFAGAIARSHRVILCGNYTARGDMQEVPLPLGQMAWGNDNLNVDEADYGVRKFYAKWQEFPERGTNVLWLPWAVAGFADGGITRVLAAPAPESAQWINYYGPPETIPSISYVLALRDNAPPGFFKDKLVFIGALQSADFSGKGKDEFRTPYSRLGRGFAPGVGIHATAAMNLIDQSWLTRLPFAAELILVLLTGTAAGLGLMRFQPLNASFIALGAWIVFGLTACVLVWCARFWFAWMIPVAQIAIALFCSVVVNSLRVYVKNRVLEQSLSSRLSPKVVKQLMDDPVLRQVGGSQQEISILFSDIANFSRVSEMTSPDDLVRLLNRYFDATLACIHETEGTVVKMLGDAIFAIWNAPVPQTDHRERAARAALRLREQLLEFGATDRGLPLRTRVGLHAGMACVGNVGSSTRFDYTAIGESVNLASRLEGLNKQIGTTLLASREIQRGAENSAVWRLVGHFRLKGFGRAVEIHELVGPLESAESSRAWREKFADALQDFRSRRFDAAETKFRETSELRQKAAPDTTDARDHVCEDGPSLFYLRKIQDYKTQPPSYEWIGEVDLMEK